MLESPILRRHELLALFAALLGLSVSDCNARSADLRAFSLGDRVRQPLAFYWFLGVAFAYAIAVHYGADLATSTGVLVFVLVYMIAREFNRVDDRIDKIGGPDRD